MPDDKPKELSPPDKKALARLVTKYGRDLIVAAAKKVRYARAGRQRDDDKRAELLEHVEWIEEHADWLRRTGHKHGALQQALSDRFRMVTPFDEQTEAELRKFEKRIKNERDAWSKTWRALKAARKDARARGLLGRPKRPRA